MNKITNLLQKVDFKKKTTDRLYIKKIIKKFKTIYENGRKIIKFDDTEIEKYKFYKHQSPIPKDNMDINKIVVSKKVSFSKK